VYKIEQYFAIQSKLKFESVAFNFLAAVRHAGKSRYYRTGFWTQRKGSFHLGLIIGRQKKILQESVNPGRFSIDRTIGRRVSISG
jgi:hypothetical protein